jgi:NADH-quinone oxidoreductase subunit L
MVSMENIVALIPALPLLGFLIISLNARRLSHGIASVLASGVVLASFVLSVAVFFHLLSLPVDQRSIQVTLWDWIAAGNFSASLSFLIDPLSIIMLLVITGVGFLIHVYSIGYMHDDEGFNKFFSYLNLFVFFMLLLVMGSNYLVMFVGWEGVGLCSYLLIGFWFKNTAYNQAANKAFIMNRIGDLGLLLGVILLFLQVGSIEYSDVFARVSGLSTETVTLIAVLLFIGAMGKSAQIPLYTWLPDAMAGPTPVSALIHAATMVTAGVYMVVRNNVLYSLSPVAMEVILIIGLATALLAAAIALTQNDIKKVLAYSTVSQLGLMFVALGVGAFSSGIFHMATHAFFKALLFLGAGSVIHALHGEQDIRNMGGLRKYLPVTWFTFAVGVLAISGLPPFAGFFSKDEILAHAFEHNPIVWGLALLTSLLTVFYMFRLFYLTFYGQVRAGQKTMDAIHESPSSITIPLILLAVLSLIGGFMNVPEVLGGSTWLQSFLAPVMMGTPGEHAPLSHATEFSLMGIVIGATLVLMVVGYVLYVRKDTVPPADEKMSGAHKLSYHKFYVDELYHAVMVKPWNWLAAQFESVVERGIIDRLVNGMGSGIGVLANGMRLWQTGSVGFYIFMMVIGVVIILTLALI